MKKISIYEKYPVLKEIPAEKFPKHILIIPDGNGRWAQDHNFPIAEGHREGAKIVRGILDELKELKEIKTITIWGFSADNWKRNATEVKAIMYIMRHALNKTAKEVKKAGGRFIHIGRKDRLPKQLLDTITKIEKDTEENSGQIISLAIDFGGEDQELRIIEKARAFDKDTQIDKEMLLKLRDGKGLITPADLLIRTAGEHRTSDIGWLNSAPTELYFIDKLFPEITTDDIVEAILVFSKRERRMGARFK